LADSDDRTESVSESIGVQALGAVRRRDTSPVVGDPVDPSDELLVFDGYDGDDPFHRFLGGTVEFGEHSREAVVREFREEVGERFVVAGRVGTFEDVFEYEGATDHQVWRVYEGHLAADWPYERDTFAYEEDGGSEHVARWLSVATLRDPETTFHSDAVLDALVERCAQGGTPSSRSS
jgi:ADP-ribose pyrophosphatase YjhB (NUDIX family)